MSWGASGDVNAPGGLSVSTSLALPSAWRIPEPWMNRERLNSLPAKNVRVVKYCNPTGHRQIEGMEPALQCWEEGAFSLNLISLLQDRRSTTCCVWNIKLHSQHRPWF